MICWQLNLVCLYRRNHDNLRLQYWFSQTDIQVHVVIRSVTRCFLNFLMLKCKKMYFVSKLLAATLRFETKIFTHMACIHYGVLYSITIFWISVVLYHQQHSTLAKDQTNKKISKILTEKSFTTAANCENNIFNFSKLSLHSSIFHLY